MITFNKENIKKYWNDSPLFYSVVMIIYSLFNVNYLAASAFLLAACFRIINIITECRIEDSIQRCASINKHIDTLHQADAKTFGLMIQLIDLMDECERNGVEFNDDYYKIKKHIRENVIAPNVDISDLTK